MDSKLPYEMHPLDRAKMEEYEALQEAFKQRIDDLYRKEAGLVNPAQTKAELVEELVKQLQDEKAKWIQSNKS